MNLQCNFDFEYFDFGFLPTFPSFSFFHTFCTLSRSSVIMLMAAPETCRTHRRDILGKVQRCTQKKSPLWQNVVTDRTCILKNISRSKVKILLFYFFDTKEHSTLSIHITYLICVKEISSLMRMVSVFYIWNLRIKSFSVNLSFSLFLRLAFYLKYRAYRYCSR